MPAGHWVALVAKSNSGWDKTTMGMVVYNGEGNLVFWKWEGTSRAIQRGDLPPHEWIKDLEIDPPKTWAEMEKRLASYANAMSIISWEGGYATLIEDKEQFEQWYATRIGAIKWPNSIRESYLRL